ncbi:MAG: glucosaminidase domain-containing protein [Odoribacteraceae bacterium]|jgi:LysM repeat protein|nr:glucosaminidase domain-containing protein [Odoribacteraceae bacterium]
MNRLSIFFLLLCWGLSPCAGQDKNARQAYIQKYSQVAIREMNRAGIPASIKLAQGILESGSGTSTLARDANNHFGIKCHDNWKGATTRMDDNRRGECFRAYGSAEESWRDHSDFLTSRPRYASLFKLGKTDYKGWARGLQAAGYATNEQYARRLIDIIEAEELHRLDRGENARGTTVSYRVGGGDSRVNYRQRVTRVNGLRCVEAREGDSFEAIAAYFGIPLWKLLEYNDKRETSLRAGMNVFLKAKKNKADKAHSRHQVREGETAYWISQKYGVKLYRVVDYNYLKINEKPRPGETLFLRGYNNAR